jgi:hypothetical protein
VWVEDEQAHIEAEGGPEVSIRAYPLPAFAERLAEDPSTPDMDEEKVGTVLAELAEAGLCELDGEGWRMTKKGYVALVDPTPPENQESGPAVLDLNAAQAVTGAQA